MTNGVIFEAVKSPYTIKTCKMNDELEKWLQDFIKRKWQQGINCKLTSYKMGKNNKYMFEVSGELRNIEIILP